MQLPREIVIAGRRIADDEAPYCLAECSHNHMGSLPLAMEMVRLAAEAGAQGVKFQRRGTSTYLGLYDSGDEDLREYARMRATREFREADYRRLRDHAHAHGLAFIATAFDDESADFLARVGLDAFKIASGDITNTPLLRYVAKLGLPMIVSTGGCDMVDVERAVAVLNQTGAEYALLHCSSSYPCSADDANLQVIATYRRKFAVPIGFSSHLHRDQWAWGSVAAHMLGAQLQEWHMSITPTIANGEHLFALTPTELSLLVSTLRTLRTALGDGTKRRLASEQTGITRLGKHLAYGRALPACHVMAEGDFAVIAPGKGVPPNQAEGLSGGILTRPVEAGEDVQAGDIQRQYSRR